MKKWRALVFTFAVLLHFLAGCGAVGLASGQIKIGFSVASRTGSAAAIESAAARTAAEAEVGLEISDANNDQAAQTKQVQAWAEQGYAAALVLLCEDAAADEVLEKAGSMPVVFLDRRPADSVLQSRANVLYIGGREAAAGKLVGEYLAHRLAAAKIFAPRIAVFAGSAENEASAERIAAAKAAFAEKGITPRYVYEKDAGWERGAAQKSFSAFLKDKPALDAVLAANDEMAIGASEALAQAGYAVSDILVAGVGAAEEGRAALRDGRLDATAYQDPQAQGAGAMQAAISLLEGNQPDDHVDSVRWLEYSLVTAENVDQKFPDDQ